MSHFFESRSDWNAVDDTNYTQYIANKPTKLSQFTNDLPLKTVAYTGSYSDLVNQPTKLSQFTNDLGLKPIATSGSYFSLTDTPPILFGYPRGGNSSAGLSGPTLANNVGVYDSGGGCAGNGGTTISVPHGLRALAAGETYIGFAQTITINQWSFIITVSNIDNTYMYCNCLKLNSGGGAAQNGITGTSYNPPGDGPTIKISYWCCIVKNNALYG